MTAFRPPAPLELWAGAECTVNRVGDRTFDQLARTGHAGRPDDLDRLAELGTTAVRFPVLWERTDPRGSGPDWAWAAPRLDRLRHLGVRPIVGLVHHGSGPPHASLPTPAFAAGLAAFAAAVARRFPDVADYTPVNEPLTTARFCGMYGHWHPHGRSDAAFVRCLLAECRATADAMAAVRLVRSDARLVQTDDLGASHGPPATRPQAEFENERRWLAWDLIAGRVDRLHSMWDYLRWAGADARAVLAFRDRPCPPAVVGVNHYVTSERYLDPDLDRHPPCTHGGNGRLRYADVEAVRACPDRTVGVAGLLRAAWERYRLPVAVTEAHLGCTREEQMRWLAEVWRAAESARAAGADVRAVTAWAAFGSYDWHTLVTRDEGVYESGLFDVRGPAPRPTALAGLARCLAAGRVPDAPPLDAPGWWHGERFPGVVADRPILITGAAGTLGRAVAQACERRGLAYVAVDRAALDIASPRAVARALDEYEPWAVVNAAGFVRVDVAEADPVACHRANVTGAAAVAAACARRGVRLVTFSTDLVFDGAAGRPLIESDAPRPLNTYGRSKALAERRVRDLHPAALVVRTAAFFGPADRHNFAAHVLRALAAGRRFAAADCTVSPTYVPHLADACLDLLIDGERGVWHLANAGATSWAAFARRLAARAGFDPAAVDERPPAALGWPAPRPAYVALASERGQLLPPLDAAVEQFFAERSGDVEEPVAHRGEAVGAL